MHEIKVDRREEQRYESHHKAASEQARVQRSAAAPLRGAERITEECALEPGSVRTGTPAERTSVAVPCALYSGVSRKRSASPLPRTRCSKADCQKSGNRSWYAQHDRHGLNCCSTALERKKQARVAFLSDTKDV